MARLKADGKTVRLIPGQKIEVVKLLADGMTRKEVSVKYHTSEKAVTRARDDVLTFSTRWRKEQPARVQKYLIFCEEKKIKREMRRRVALENNANRVVVTDNNHIEEQSSKAKVNTQFLEDHYKVLSTIAMSIADLVHYVGADIGEQTISQIVDKLGTWQGGDPPAGQLEQFDELSDLLSSTEAKWLLSHIKYEAPALFVHIMYAHPEYFTFTPYEKPELEHIDRWEDMTQDDISEYGENLIDLLKLRAGRLDFKGTCDYCEGRK